MTGRLLIVFVAFFAISLAVGAALVLPVRYTITFSASGFNGDEEIRLSKNWGTQTVLPLTVLGKDFGEFSATTWFPVFNLHLYCSNLNSESPPRQTTILFGVIKVSQWNILGNLVDESDWLNIDSGYRSDQGRTFAADSPAMATIRSGITGWTGYYVLRAP
ncbi:hypothetical protein [Rhizobium sp. SGZ-381]|uniref:hypothetical protein n=1 Tax=Rhizobium sp. SGZ-381 TaxID=3342800 RepID=UPI00366C7BD7